MRGLPRRLAGAAWCVAGLLLTPELPRPHRPRFEEVASGQRRLDESSSSSSEQVSTLVDEDYGQVTVTVTSTESGATVTASSTLYVPLSATLTASSSSSGTFRWSDAAELEGDSRTCEPSCTMLVVIPTGSSTIMTSTSGFTLEFGRSDYGDALTSYDETSFAPPLSRETIRVGQGYNGTFSHQGVYALDMNCDLGEPVYPTRDGVVWRVVSQYSEQCTDASICVSEDLLANVVYVAHCDGTYTNYVHLDGPDLVEVEIGDVVRARIDSLGPCGTTGFSTGPHLHLEAWAALVTAENRVRAETVPTSWDDCVGESFVPGDKETFRLDGSACLAGFDDCPDASSSSKKKKAHRLASSTELVVVDFVAFFVLASVSLGLALACLRALPDPPEHAPLGLLVLLLAWFVTCSDITLTYVEYEDEINYDAWAFSAATLIVTLVVHLCVTFAMYSQYALHDFDWVRDHKWILFPALVFALPALDGLALVLPWQTRTVHSFPTRPLCAFSLLRLFLLDAPQFLLKLIVYQSRVGFSLFAFVSALASLCLVVILAARLVALLRDSATVSSSRNSRKDSQRDGPLFIPPPTVAWEPPSTVDAADDPEDAATEMVNVQVGHRWH